MRALTYLNLILISVLFLNSCNSKKEKPEDSDSPVKKNTYLGQILPGLTPQPFAPGVVTTDGWEYGSTFSPDLKEFYFIRESEDKETQQFVVFQKKDSIWLNSVISQRVGQPIISPDGKRMHLGRRYKKRTKDGWSEVKMLDAPFGDLLIMRLSASANGTYYFDTYDENREDFPIRYSRLVDGQYEEPEALPKEINTGTFLNHPFIAPDESYLIWDAVREGGYGDSDLYISFKQKDESWGEAINLGEKINTEAEEIAASVTPDGKYLFFNRNVGSDEYENIDIFWVDAQIIEKLRPKRNE
ncbi:TolB-like translocation protein [Portibacter marinus]|uniref:hypothetical protein n=1 Tax=Portibacter marinus TaxID=2898660 RepID=UPI001F1B7DB4|nr:hypothetical protein [Portibacter marinus]